MKAVFRRTLPALLLTVLPAALAHGLSYETYTNVRFGYRVDYPVPELIPQPEAPNGDGRVFRSADGQAEMRVFGACLQPDRARTSIQAFVADACLLF